MLLGYYMPFCNGFLLSMGLIIGFGPQNTLILHQGLRRQHLLVMIVVCTLIDAGFILLGAVGVGGVLGDEILKRAMIYTSATLLLAYRLRAFRAACWPIITTGSDVLPNRKQIVTMLLVVSLLNPRPISTRWC